MAKRKLYIHVGPHKTGSSTIQRGLVLNREVLKKKGFDYPEIAFTFSGHHGLVSDLKGSFDPNIGGLDDIIQYARASDNNMILSSETFDEIYSAAPLKRLEAALTEIFDIKIIAYLRPQEELLQSLWQTSVLFNNISDDFGIWLPNAIRQHLFLKYDFWLGLFAKVFEEENLLIKLFDPKTDDLLFSFLATCGIKNFDDLNVQPRANISLPPLTFDLARHLYIYRFLDRAKKNQKTVRAMLLPLDKMAETVARFAEEENLDLNHSAYNSKMLTRVQAQYHSHNQAVAKRYFNQPRLFSSRKTMKPNPNRLLDLLTSDQTLRLCGSLIEMEQSRTRKFKKKNLGKA